MPGQDDRAHGRSRRRADHQGVQPARAARHRAGHGGSAVARQGLRRRHGQSPGSDDGRRGCQPRARAFWQAHDRAQFRGGYRGAALSQGSRHRARARARAGGRIARCSTDHAEHQCAHRQRRGQARSFDARPYRREHGCKEAGMSFTSVEQAPLRLNRWELAVPGSMSALFEKAAKSGADVIFLDLEDAVAPDDKEQARKNVVAALNDIDWGTKTLSVRINGLDTHYMYRDVIDLVENCPRLDMLLIPKIGVPADVYALDMLVTQIEQARPRVKRIGFEVLIET